MEQLLILLAMMTLAVVVGRGLERKRRGEPFGWSGMLRGLLYLVLAGLAIVASLWAIWAGFGFVLALAVFAMCDNGIWFNAGPTPPTNARSRFDRNFY